MRWNQMSPVGELTQLKVEVDVEDKGEAGERTQEEVNTHFGWTRPETLNLVEILDHYK